MNLRKIRKTSLLQKATPTFEYVVRPGDTLCSLAVQCNTSTSCLRSLNSRVGCDLPLMPGTVLNLPLAASGAESQVIGLDQQPEPFRNDSQQQQSLQKPEEFPQKIQSGNRPQIFISNKQNSADPVDISNTQAAEFESPRLLSPASQQGFWSLHSRPSSMDEADDDQSLGWTFLDLEVEQRIQPGRSSLPLPRLLIPKFELAESTTPEAYLAEEILLTPSRLTSLVQVLPPRAEGLDLCQVFSTRRHGHSLRSLYEVSHNAGLDPATCCLLLVSIADSDTLLGAFLPCPLRLPAPYGCYGTGETLLLSWSGVNQSHKQAEQFKFYTATNGNAMFLRSSRDYFSVGAGALTLRSELQTGSSEASETFASPPLVEGSEFRLGNVQLWAFQVVEKSC